MLAEKSLEFLSERSRSDSARLREAVFAYLSKVLDASEAEMWSSVFDPDRPNLFTDTLHATDGKIYWPPFSSVLTREQVMDRLSNRVRIEVEANPVPHSSDLQPPRIIIGVTTSINLRQEEYTLVSKVLKRIISDYFEARTRHIYEMMVNASHQSKDLTSFLHRAIHLVLIPEFKVDAASVFYYEQKTRSLILGATTGIARQERYGLKRSDMRYFVDDKSYTARCWRTGREIVENEFVSRLKANTIGEQVTELHSRVYAPLRRWMGQPASETTLPIGVIRAVNFNHDANFHPVTVMEATRFRVFCDAASVLTERYVRTLSILHDQERATHGYNTDLAAIRYAAQNIQRWLSRFDDPNLNKVHIDLALQEVKYRTRDILAVQDNMASQIITVMHHSGSTRLISRPNESVVCSQPYIDVIMRLVHGKKGMSECYGRNELRLTFNGKAKADEAFIKLPALKVTIGGLYLVFRNLAENSIKYSRKGIVPQLDISWKEDGKNVEFAFTDNGTGIPKDEHHLVLREGFRGRHAQELQLRGNGLGLAVSKAMLDAVGGELVFEPRLGDTTGACFLVRVPMQ